MVRLLKNDKKQDAVKVWGYTINISLCVMCLIVGGFFVFAPDIMSLFYSEKYVTVDGVTVFRIYTLILLLRSTYFGVVLNATGRTKLVFYSSILTLVLNLIANVGFYYLFGFIGPAVASLVVIVLMSFVQLLFTCKIIKIKMRMVFPWKNIIKMLGQTILFATVFGAIKYHCLGRTTRTMSIAISIGLGVIWAVLFLRLNYKFILENWRKLNEQKNS